MKWFKRITFFVVGLAIVLALAAVGAYVFGVRGTPDWLERPVFSAEQRAAAANRMDQKILETLSQVQEMYAYDPGAQSRPAGAGGDKRPAATQPATQLKVTFTEEELNASFQKWDQLYGWTQRYQNYIKDPAIVLHDGRIILAGQSEELHSLVSLHFEPKLDADGQLDLKLSQVLAGRLPIPQGFFEKYRTSARTKLHGVLPELQRKAEFKPDGSANVDAMSAAMAKLFLHVLDEETAEPALFLPVGDKRAVPVRLRKVSIENHELTLIVKPLTANERSTLLERIRATDEKPGRPAAETAVNTTDKRPRTGS
jgi:hypothetical protein